MIADNVNDADFGADTQIESSGVNFKCFAEDILKALETVPEQHLDSAEIVFKFAAYDSRGGRFWFTVRW